jgi:uncharacterized membrane protein YhaH (DUF805 family)
VPALPNPRAVPAAPDARAAGAWPDGDPDAPWRMLLSAEGRISRRRFWLWGVGAMLGLALVLHGLLAVARVRLAVAEHVVNVLLLWPVLAISIKRWHDRDRPGWWALLALVPVVGWLWLLLANGFLRGTPGANRYGPPPPDVSSGR